MQISDYINELALGALWLIKSSPLVPWWGIGPEISCLHLNASLFLETDVTAAHNVKRISLHSLSSVHLHVSFSHPWFLLLLGGQVNATRGLWFGAIHRTSIIHRHRRCHSCMMIFSTTALLRNLLVLPLTTQPLCHAV